MDLVAATLVSVAVLSLGLGMLAPKAPQRPVLARLFSHSRGQLAAARVGGDPRLFVAVSVLAPPVFLITGWTVSPVLGVMGAMLGLAAPRLYLRWLIHLQSSRAEAEAPRLLQGLLAGLAGKGTYLDALREARSRCTDRWLGDDLDQAIQGFLLDTPLHVGFNEIRSRTRSRNLALIWETLRICTENHLPTAKARTLLLQLNSTVQFNVQLRNEVKARARGQQAQIWLLALIVPGMFVYLRLMSPDLLSVLDHTIVGRFVLLPVATLLELLGIVLSFRIARVNP